MSRNGPAEKGSQKHLQDLINIESNRTFFAQEIENAINIQEINGNKLTFHWSSPLQEENYKEYRDNEFLKRLQIDFSRLDYKLVNNFWPKTGPCWDALGTSESMTGDKLILIVEAKAHIYELVSSCGSQNQANQEMIRTALENTASFMGSENNSNWADYFYQYTNRLAHLYFFLVENQNYLSRHNITPYLILVYFYNVNKFSVQIANNDKDERMREILGASEHNIFPINKEQWSCYLDRMKKSLGIKPDNPLETNILDIFIDINMLNPG